MEVTIKRFNSEDILNPSFMGFIFRCITHSKVELLYGKINVNKVEHVIESYSTDQDKTLLVAMIGEEYVGVLAGKVATFHFTDVMIGSELFFRVDSQYRGNGIGKKLIHEFAIWCKEKGARHMQMGVSVFAAENYTQAIAAFKSDGFKDFHFEYYKEV